MTPTAVMIPMQQTVKIEAVNKQPLQIKGETQSFSNFSKLLQEQGQVKKVQPETIKSESDKDIPAEKMIDELLALEVKELEEILTNLMTEQELSEEDLFMLTEMNNKLQELMQDSAESAKEGSNLSIIEPVIHMGSNHILKAMIEHYSQPEHQDYIARALPVGEIRIIERINEDGTLVLRPVEPFNDFSEIQQEAKQVLNQVEDILNNIRSVDDVSKTAPRILELLQQWQKLVVQTGTDADKLTNLNLEDRQLAGVWKQLVQAYQNRVGMQSQNSYNLDAKVTANDIARWLNSALETTLQTEKPTQQAAAVTQAMLMSKVEQFVIHLNRPQQTQPVDKQLIEQFQKIMDSNRITNLQSGRGQLAITLKPHHLGEMLVRFTQVNGEMVVKILVTSESSQKILEGNMQQLRSMFSPHQVVIERQEAILTGNQESQKHQERNDQQGTRDDAQPEEQHLDNESFSNIFEELIVNEEV